MSLSSRLCGNCPESCLEVLDEDQNRSPEALFLSPTIVLAPRRFYVTSQRSLSLSTICSADQHIFSSRTKHESIMFNFAVPFFQSSTCAAHPSPKSRTRLRDLQHEILRYKEGILQLEKGHAQSNPSIIYFYTISFANLLAI